MSRRGYVIFIQQSMVQFLYSVLPVVRCQIDESVYLQVCFLVSFPQMCGIYLLISLFFRTLKKKAYLLSSFIYFFIDIQVSGCLYLFHFYHFSRDLLRPRDLRAGAHLCFHEINIAIRFLSRSVAFEFIWKIFQARMTKFYLESMGQIYNKY